jgi:hypothetical protein
VAKDNGSTISPKGAVERDTIRGRWQKAVVLDEYEA